MIKTLITEFPLSDLPKERTITEEKIRKYTYTKEEVRILLEAAVKEAVMRHGESMMINGKT